MTSNQSYISYQNLPRWYNKSDNTKLMQIDQTDVKTTWFRHMEATKLPSKYYCNHSSLSALELYSPVRILDAKNSILFIWTHKEMTTTSFEWGQEALEDHKYLSNVNSAMLDSSENKTLLHTNHEQRIYSFVQILNAKIAILGLSRNTSFGKDNKTLKVG